MAMCDPIEDARRRDSLIATLEAAANHKTRADLHAEIDRLRKERDEARAQALEEAADTAFVSARMGMTSEQIHAEICALKEKQG